VILQQLKVILGLETSGFPSARQAVRGFTQGIQRDISQLKNFVGGFFTAQFGTELVRSVVQMTGRFKDLSETSGESLETIQKYDQVFKKFGSSAEDAIKIFDDLALSRKEALEQGGEAGIRLQTLGLTVDEIQSLETGRKLYERIAQIANNPSNPEVRTAFLEQFGRKIGGKALAGAAALAEGGQFTIISDAQIQELDAAAKSFERAALEFKLAAVPLVTTLLDWINTAVKFWGSGTTIHEERQKTLMQDAFATGGGIFGIGADQNVSEAGRQRARELRAEMFDAGGLTSALKPVSPARLDEIELELRRIRMGRKVAAVPLPADSMPSVDRFDPESGLRAVTAAAFKAPNEEDKKKMLREQIAAMPQGSFRADSAAGIGALIGGASSIDPSLRVAESQLEVLRRIASDSAATRRAIEQRNQPFNDVR
jgi:hypothetical protein